MNAPRDARVLKGGIAILVWMLMGLIGMALLQLKVPPENKDLLNLIVGALIANAGAVVGDLFGNSRGSTKSDSP
jgi:hypothetical protein